ncbi:MAG: Bro-N domain-containing protein [Patescibacteria group bacterium]
MLKKQSSQNKSIIIFEDTPARRVWVEKEKKWYFAIIDVVAILAESSNPAGYIKDMRRRDKALSEGWGQIATPLSIQTKGGKQKANCANVKGIFRIIQSIPSPKAEPFKRWLAKVGYERIYPVRYEIIKRGEEIEDPELATKRTRRLYKLKGYSDGWIHPVRYLFRKYVLCLYIA